MKPVVQGELHMLRLSLTALAACGTALVAYAAGAQTLPTTVGLPSPATQTVNLTGGGVANVVQNPNGAGGTGTVTGSVVAGGVTTQVSCGYNVATGVVTGGAQCSQILSGANLANFTRSIVSGRVASAADELSAMTTNLVQGTIETRLTQDLIINIQASGQAGGSSSGGFGDSVGSFGVVGGGFYDDERLGLEKDGESFAVTAGLDKAIGQVLLGGTVGYINNDVDLEAINGDLSSKGWLVGGYLGYIFNDVVSLTGGLSYVDSNVDLTRTTGATSIAADYGQKEWNGSLTLNAFQRTGDLGITGQVGLTYNDWRTGAYTDSSGLAFAKAKGDTTAARAGAVLSLFASPGFTPYASAAYNHIISERTFGQDRGSLDAAAGMSFGWGSGYGSLEVSKTFLRENQSSTTVGLHIRFIL